MASRLRQILGPLVAAALTSRRFQSARERAFEFRRRRKGAPRVLDWMHQADDPYSHLLAQALPEFLRAYDVLLRLYVVPPPDRAAAPEPEMLERYSLRDAKYLAEGLGFHLPRAAERPAPELVALANRRLVALPREQPNPADVIEIGRALWAGDRAALESGRLAEEASTTARIEEDRRWREKHRHYLGATLHYGGVWYWGTDRLLHLSERLDRVGARRPGGREFSLSHDGDITLPALAPPFEVFFSFRSPYSAIAMPRVFELSRRYNVELALRPVLPMVMRGLPVPSAKRLYIVQDTKREADRIGVPFGKAMDPVGPGAERCLAVTHALIGTDRAEPFILSAMRGIWAEGVDVATDSGLQTVAERAGVPWSRVQEALADSTWRDAVEANREELFSLDMWGVPSFRLGDFAAWGQDRLWLVERALHRLAERA